MQVVHADSATCSLRDITLRTHCNEEPAAARHITQQALVDTHATIWPASHQNIESIPVNLWHVTCTLHVPRVNILAWCNPMALNGAAIHMASEAEIDTCIDRLQGKKQEWASLPIREKVNLLMVRQCVNVGTNPSYCTGATSKAYDVREFIGCLTAREPSCKPSLFAHTTFGFACTHAGIRSSDTHSLISCGLQSVRSRLQDHAVALSSSAADIRGLRNSKVSGYPRRSGSTPAKCVSIKHWF